MATVRDDLLRSCDKLRVSHGKPIGDLLSDLDPLGLLEILWRSTGALGIVGANAANISGKVQKLRSTKAKISGEPQKLVSTEEKISGKVQKLLSTKANISADDAPRATVAAAKDKVADTDKAKSAARAAAAAAALKILDEEALLLRGHLRPRGGCSESGVEVKAHF